MTEKPNAGDRLELLLQRVQLFYYEHCDDAWGKIRQLFSKPWAWIAGTLGVFLLAACIVGLFFLGSIHAPSLPDAENGDAAVEGAWDESDLSQPISASGRRDNVFTFLLVGTDAGGGNTDTIMVAAYDIAEQSFNLLSVPRDTMVNVSWDIKKINSVYSVYGMDGLKEHIGKLLGFSPDYYIKINVQAFVDVIDLLGGVYYDVPRDMDYDDPAQDLYIHIKKGYQHLDGYNSMCLVRWRHNNDYTLGYSDEERMKTQQNFLKVAAEQCMSLKNWTKVKDLIDLFYTYVESDLSLGEMLWFAKQAAGIGTEGSGISMSDIHTFTMPGDYSASAWSRSYRNYQSYVIPNADELVALINSSFNPYHGHITASRLDVMRIHADGSISSSTGFTADTKAEAYAHHSSDGESTNEGISVQETEGGDQQGIRTEATGGNLQLLESDGELQTQEPMENDIQQNESNSAEDAQKEGK